MFYLSKQQAEVIRPYVHGQSVLDLGAADLRGTQALLEFGAVEVLAVDRNPMPDLKDPRVTYWKGYFHDLKVTRKVALASWIVNWNVGVEAVFERVGTILSLSKNFDGVCCGYPAMWEYLSHREVLAYVPHVANTLTIYGPAQVSRDHTGEERAALDLSRIYSYEETC